MKFIPLLTRQGNLKKVLQILDWKAPIGKANQEKRFEPL